MKILEIIIAVGLVVGVIVGLLFLLGVFTSKDYENLKKKVSEPVKDFFTKVRDPEKRANMNLKENWVLWLSWSFFGIIFGIWFYIVGLGAVAMIKVMNFLGLRKVEQEDGNQEEEKRSSLWESFKNQTIGFLKRAKDPEERKKMDVDEYLLFMMLSTIPFSIPTVGLYLYFFAIGGLLTVIVAEEVTGYKFTNIGDLKNFKKVLNEHQEKIANLKKQLAAKTDELEQVQTVVSEAMTKTNAKEMKKILGGVVKKDGMWIVTN